MAGTVVLSDQRREGVIRWARILATADAADGSFPAKALRELGVFIDGPILAVQVNPGSTAPTAGYDITLVDADGADRLSGVGVNRSATATERLLVPGAAFAAPDETLTLTIAGSSVNSATVEILLYHTPSGMAAGGSADQTISVVAQDWTPTVDTSGAHTALDALHTADVTLSGMGAVPGGSGIITNLVVIDLDDNASGAGVLHLFSKTLANTTHTANVALAVHDTDAAYFIGSIPFGLPSDLGNSTVYTNGTIRLPYKCDPADTALYAVAQTLGAPTYTGASQLRFRLLAEVDQA